MELCIESNPIYYFITYQLFYYLILHVPHFDCSVHMGKMKPKMNKHNDKDKAVFGKIIYTD